MRAVSLTASGLLRLRRGAVRNCGAGLAPELAPARRVCGIRPCSMLRREEGERVTARCRAPHARAGPSLHSTLRAMASSAQVQGGPASDRMTPAEPGPGSAAEERVSIATPANTGILNVVPVVAPGDETLQSALKRASRITATPGMAREASDAAKARKRATRQLDGLTQALAVPLGTYVRGFPKLTRLHPFERALVDLTVGTPHYERTMARVDLLRKGILECGKGHTSFANRSHTEVEAESRRKAGFTELETLFRRGSGAVDDLKEIAKLFRSLPVAELDSPTVTLVGAPNVGKSSLVRLLSSGKPEVQNYPFTTRGIIMGHIMVDTKRRVVTDTPGVLSRPDGVRNKMERLTLAALAFLPVSVLFVLDLSGGCGTRVADQLAIREELRERFPEHPWLDVLSKCDLPYGANEAEEAAAAAASLPDALRVSITTEEGTAELSRRLLGILAEREESLARQIALQLAEEKARKQAREEANA